MMVQGLSDIVRNVVGICIDRNRIHELKRLLIGCNKKVLI